MALHFYFASTTLRFAVFVLTSDMLVNKHSDFLALGFLTVVTVLRKLRLTSVIFYGLDTIVASRISLRFFVITLTCMLINIFYVIQNNFFKRIPDA